MAGATVLSGSVLAKLEEIEDLERDTFQMIHAHVPRGEPACTLKDQSARISSIEMVEFHTDACLCLRPCSAPSSLCLVSSLWAVARVRLRLSPPASHQSPGAAGITSPPPVFSDPPPPLWLHYLRSGSELLISHMDHITMSLLSPPAPSHPSSALLCSDLAKMWILPCRSLG